MRVTAWYDRVARLYDALPQSRYYMEARQLAVRELRLRPGDTVFDVGCGTGASFASLASALGGEGVIVGVDGSPGMLRRSQAAASEHRSKELTVEVMRLDLSADLSTFVEEIDRLKPNAFLFALSLTCLPNWWEVLHAVFEAAPQKSRFAVMDVHSDRLSLGARFVNWTAAADITRPVWKVLEERAEGFGFRTFRPFSFIDATVVVASGGKGDALNDCSGVRNDRGQSLSPSG